ncbi:exoglucanase-6A precursor [Pyrenophora tritici-repentis]|uniref:Glucanase n=2 Tax=Pyrenophora tritici-repentis TaxID=45151 RepID=A0A2W1E3H2_9PLEO|nr:exoglucanase-6A precursor [Pyrenophora tritici-repentis Pt-1C-BFP]KAA8620531.1 Glucanase [Pyrenophora tritici-repentis]EDU46282.1 exoglucanase-6A precursor [Pyrenophora tritici-repentis Pt-1C-BFP]KAF7448681.1 Glucanase [Pyrenophora tritici-repentis]KAF7572404.1 Glyco-hydro-6 multi-domain protein [Pyrenophora tritici-repentis]KAG9384422.1 Glucanase [Pyrenophora tritici-repentis]
MLSNVLFTAALAAGVAQALPQATGTPKPTGTSPSMTTAAASGNPFAGYNFYANPYYSSEVYTLAMPSLAASLKPAATAVANIGSFVWMDTMAKVPLMDTYLANIKAKNAAGAKLMGTFVVYDLPDRDCAALASNGELKISEGGAEKYKKQYIDKIAAIIQKYPDVKINLAIEPDSLANMVTNLGVAKCANAAPYYKDLTAYAISKLNFANVDMYLDGGHAGWLGWDANIGPAAKLYADVYKAAGKPRAVRGIVTNVSNYNAFRIATCPAITQGNKNCDEERYINAFAPLLQAEGFPAHFIVDTGRSGKQPTGQQAWGDWCNVSGAGFGARPSTNTGNANVDAFVWVKPGGESDGTSDQSAARYDSHCGVSSALKPAPEAGTWFQAYFEMLLKNASPALA